MFQFCLLIEGESYLPILLQRLESNLVLNHICERISQSYPEAPILPVHDCIYTTQRYAESVQVIMRDTLNELTGYMPGIKMEKSSAKDTLQALKNTAKEDLNLS